MIRGKYVKVERAGAEGVAARWRSSYWRGAEKGWRDAGKQSIHERLVALGEHPEAAAVDAITGNQSWTRIMCDGCSEYVTCVVAIGEYEARRYCRACILEAAEVLRAP